MLDAAVTAIQVALWKVLGYIATILPFPVPGVGMGVGDEHQRVQRSHTDNDNNTTTDDDDDDDGPRFRSYHSPASLASALSQQRGQQGQQGQQGQRPHVQVTQDHTRVPVALTTNTEAAATHAQEREHGVHQPPFAMESDLPQGDEHHPGSEPPWRTQQQGAGTSTLSSVHWTNANNNRAQGGTAMDSRGGDGAGNGVLPGESEMAQQPLDARRDDGDESNGDGNTRADDEDEDADDDEENDHDGTDDENGEGVEAGFARPWHPVMAMQREGGGGNVAIAMGPEVKCDTDTSTLFSASILTDHAVLDERTTQLRLTDSSPVQFLLSFTRVSEQLCDGDLRELQVSGLVDHARQALLCRHMQQAYGPFTSAVDDSTTASMDSALPFTTRTSPFEVTTIHLNFAQASTAITDDTARSTAADGDDIGGGDGDGGGGGGSSWTALIMDFPSVLTQHPQRPR
ncbi:hypothetical protein PTSG_08117 [Salpingoeca rosetta]|uniref:Uncharacterized protein n=1 Tax=Salpingoeca rosetta (strain ATCC 50818 / BSB-021) TaxID=946362 RepID=F2UI16_SALR5|nr:uncharacterized protein PTSG_08117 [Salpingoeca rosetta]EGD76765.1 hypothetical protein PTSG_08117 [Salpingoeca rosetta]|eukprot:XP_004991137.1 hypothetical protein PTSG_08117 [Salpingoeca rosetta]